MITQERLKELLHYDPETGVFTWKVRPSSHVYPGMRAGYVNTQGYRGIRIDKELLYEHRLAWLYVHGVMPEYEIDHDDRNRGNNALVNLRPATPKQNRENTNIQANNKSGYRGVCFFKRDKTWHAQIHHHGKRIHIGYFKTPHEASIAYEQMRDKLFTHHKKDY